MGVAIRLALVGVLLLALAGMSVHYAVAADDHDRTRIGHAKLHHYGSNLGETAFFWAEAVEAGERLRVEVGDVTVRLTAGRPAVRKRLAAIEPGDAVQVYGRLTPGRVVVVRRVVRSPTAGMSVMYAVSALAGVLAVAFFLARWRFDADRLAFVPRGGDDA